MEKDSKPAEQKTAGNTETPIGDNKNSEVVTESKSSNNKVLVIVLIVIGALVVLGAIGSILVTKVFKKAATTIVENSTGTSVTTDDNGTTTVKTSEGSVTTSTEQKLPDGFPSSVPLYSGQTIVDSYKSKNTMGTYWQVSAQTSDSVKTAVINIKEKYSKWESTAETENDGTYTFYYKDSKYTVNINITENSGKTTITYMVSEETPTE